jgi:hypothetical protein
VISARASSRARCEFHELTPMRIATRKGILWDVCEAGPPAFRRVVQPHLEHEVTHVGVAGC